jgi:SsrA-binding protein
MNIKNKKAYFNFEFIEDEIAGIVLNGTEIKSIRKGNVNFKNTFCIFINNELWIKNLHIKEYDKGTYNNHDPERDKKLLLTKKQLTYFRTKVEEKGLTIVPKNLFINEKGIVKLNISLAKGKKEYDKKNIIKENDIKKEMDREIKNLKI